MFKSLKKCNGIKTFQSIFQIILNIDNWLKKNFLIYRCNIQNKLQWNFLVGKQPNKLLELLVALTIKVFPFLWVQGYQYIYLLLEYEVPTWKQNPHKAYSNLWYLTIWARVLGVRYSELEPTDEALYIELLASEGTKKKS